MEEKDIKRLILCCERRINSHQLEIHAYRKKILEDLRELEQLQKELKQKQAEDNGREK